MKAKRTGRGGRRPGAGRPRTLPVSAALRAFVLREAGLETAQALDEIRRLLAKLHQQRRDEGERREMFLRRLVALERAVRGEEPKPPRHTRARPLGVE